MNDDNRKFYVYEHWRPDANVCFYVGKGQRRRAYKMKARGRHHENIVAKLLRLNLSVAVHIIARDLDEETAFDLERARIALYGRENLVNGTDGGEGVTGLRHTAEWREKMRARAIGNKHSAGRKLSEEHRRAIARANTGNTNRLGHTTPPETRAKQRAALLGRKQDPEIGRRISAAKKGMVFTAAHRAKLSAAKIGNQNRRKSV